MKTAQISRFDAARRLAGGAAAREEAAAAAAALDRACLLLCISLLDHKLMGCHFESAVLGFLAMLGINNRHSAIFRGPLSYLPDLPKFINIAQIFVLQRAVLTADKGESEHPSYPPEEMRDGFIVRCSRAAFNWACQLRVYARTVASNTTALGYIT